MVTMNMNTRKMMNRPIFLQVTEVQFVKLTGDCDMIGVALRNDKKALELFYRTNDTFLIDLGTEECELIVVELLNIADFRYVWKDSDLVKLMLNISNKET